MTITYNSSSGTVIINTVGTTATIGFPDAIAIVGGYDSNNAGGSVTAGEPIEVGFGDDPANLFGTDSELNRQIQTIGGAGTIYATPVPETELTETFASTQSGALDNSGIFDPRVHPDHEITAQDDTGNTIDVTIVDEDSVSTPSSADTININPRTGEWQADASDTYDITYTHGDYTTAIQNTASKDVRYIGVCTEEASAKATLVTELENEAQNLNFKRGVVGSHVDIQPGEVSSYTPSQQDWRLIEVAPSRGTMTDGAVRTIGAMLGTLALQPVDPSGSVLHDEVTGLSDLNVKYRDTEADDFEQVTAIARDFGIVTATTTSSDSELQPIYKAEIIDLCTETFAFTADQYVAGPNVPDRRKNLRAGLRRVAVGFASQSPPVLGQTDGSKPYDISVDTAGSDSNVDVTIAIKPTPIMRTIDINLNVGDVTTFGGVA